MYICLLWKKVYTVRIKWFKSIYHFQEKTKDSVFVNCISEILRTKAASLTDMIKRLADKKVVDYHNYKKENLLSVTDSMLLPLLF